MDWLGKTLDKAATINAAISIVLALLYLTQPSSVFCAPPANIPNPKTAIYNIADYGAVGDGRTDNAPIINKLLHSMPATGGEILIPAGEFLINAPLEITSSFITIRGVNRGWRSNVDAAVQGVTFPAGGSKLLLGPLAISGFHISGGKPARYSSISITDLMIQGTRSVDGQAGIRIDQACDGTVIDNVSCINLGTGISIDAGDAGRISGCLVAECRNCIRLNHCIEYLVSEDSLGAQPRGVTCEFDNNDHLLMTGCNIFPDGFSAIRLENSSFCTISSCEISGWYTGLIDISGDDNSVLSDSIRALKRGASWPADPINRDGTYGLIRVAGEGNAFLNCAIYSDQPSEDYRIRCCSGNNNNFSFLSMDGNPSPNKVVIDADLASHTRVIDSVTTDEFRIIGKANSQIFVPVPLPSSAI